MPGRIWYLSLLLFRSGEGEFLLGSGVREIEGFWLLVFDKDDFLGCDGGGKTTLLGDLGFFLKLRKIICSICCQVILEYALND